MGKLATYLVLMSGLTLLFYFFGLVQNTGTSTLLTLVLSPENLENTSFSTLIISALSLAGILASVVLGFSNQNVELAATGTLAIFLFNLGWDFLSVFNRVRAQNEPLALLIFAPLLLLYCVTIVEWWRGRD